MPQTSYSQAGTAPIAYDYLKDADEAIKTYLTTTNATATLDSLYDFLTVATFRTRAEEQPVVLEGPGRYPLVYLLSTAGMPVQKGKSLVVPMATRLTVWSSQGNPVDSCAECAAIAGAIASMLKQTLHDGSATDWSTFYSNHYEDESPNNVRAVQEPRLEANAQGAQTALAKAVLEASWFHYEEVS